MNVSDCYRTKAYLIDIGSVAEFTISNEMVVTITFKKTPIQIDIRLIAKTNIENAKVPFVNIVDFSHLLRYFWRKNIDIDLDNMIDTFTIDNNIC